MKSIFTVACRVPGGYGEYIGFDSKATLLDADLILFLPAFRSYFSQEEHLGKPLLSDSRSFALQESIAHWHRELDTVLKAGKNVFMLINAPMEVFVSTGGKKRSGTSLNRTSTKFVRLLRNYELLPFSVEVIESRGNSMTLHRGESILRDYWRNFGESSSFQAFIRGSNDMRPLVVTRSGDQSVGAIYKTKSGGALVLLPWVDLYREDFFTHAGDEIAEIAEFGNDFYSEYIDDEEQWTPKAKGWGRKFLDTLESLDKALRSETELTPVPQWARDDRFRTNQEAVLSEQLLRNQSTISELEKERVTIEENLEGAEYLKPLLYEQGHTLEQAVLAAMELMGFEANSYRDSDSEFDVVLECDEGRCIGEVEGRDNKAIGIDKMRQLEVNILEDLDRDEVSKPAKSILFGNAFRLELPSDRPAEHFTPKCLSAAERNGTALIRTCDLFDVAKALSDQPDAQFAASCREAILNTKGKEVDFPSVSEIEVNTTRIEKSLGE